MKELEQAREFFEALTGEQKKDMTDAIAEDIYFLDESLQKDVTELMKKISPILGEAIANRNNFTI